MKRVILSVIAASSIQIAHAQSVQAPVPVQNEKWSYQTTDQWTSKVTQTINVTVVGVLGNYIRQQNEVHNVTSSGQQAPTQTLLVTLPSDLNVVSTINGERIVNRIYDWPLTSGKKWHKQSKVASTMTLPTGLTPAVFTSDTDAEVAGWEDVQTPAGNFKALKIVYKSKTTVDIMPTFSSTSTETSWYSPDVHRNVKYTSEAFGASGEPLTSTVQLLVAHSQ
ncbi:hypothetical protein FHW67_001633 [Herbaspirillum sp. Sphag1AN]|uniref:TapB family protein n=1 Tax=unclassified Herbaspirillum TaxID=2624150 RepID=UPI0016100431|nr:MULTISPECIES: hypothetical protein [unclassified Herbaspirillum]MBB3212353.1 hypothetical protein [Herbaspirillum sp. Sphag1AN]MBB3245548.1 hypothetical protein [Herbaspirillum sp. Sphag64]